MKTLLTIFALTAGFTAHAVTLPLIGLPLKPAPQKLALKKTSQGKKLAAGMVFGPGVRYFCTGTAFSCGLTADETDVTPVVKADTGLRDIIEANESWAMDSSGNVYRRGNRAWDSRPMGVAGETISYAGGSTYHRQLCPAGKYIGAAAQDSGKINQDLYGECTPADLVPGNDWRLIGTGAIALITPPPQTRPIASHAQELEVNFAGYQTPTELKIYGGSAAFGFQTPLTLAIAGPRVVNSKLYSAAGDLLHIAPGDYAGVSSNILTEPYLNGRTHTLHTAHNPPTGGKLVALGHPALIGPVNLATRRAQVTLLPLARSDMPGTIVYSGLGPWTLEGDYSTVSSASRTLGTAYWSNNWEPQQGGYTWSAWADASSSAWNGLHTFSVVVPGTGDIADIQPIWRKLLALGGPDIFLRTTTGENWRFNSTTKTWAALP